LGSPKPLIGNQVRLILILLSLLFLPILSFGQSERPETIIIPVSSMGDVSDTRKQILQNTLENELKTHFRLVPQQKFEEVQEKVFEELEYEECTEDQCIMMIQEMLQVENVFHLQVIGEGSDTQLSLGWRTLDEKRNEEDYCEGCGTGELRKMIGVLVEKLVGGKKVEPEPVVIVSRDDEEELRKQREEELRRQREEKQEDEEDLKSLSVVNEIFQSRKYNLLGMYVSSYINVKNEPKRVSPYINYLSYDGFGIGVNYYHLDNYHYSTNVFVGYLTRITKTTSDNSTNYSYLDLGKVSDSTSSEFFDMFGENFYVDVSFNRNWIYKKWNFWLGGGLYSESGSGTIITSNEIIKTSFSSSGPLFDGGVDYNFENGINIFMRMIGALYTSPITQEVNKQDYETDVNSSIKYNVGLGFNL
jgi:hypothetical protein